MIVLIHRKKKFFRWIFRGDCNPKSCRLFKYAHVGFSAFK